jgi:magnesium-protoporphyrin O-methyltransferase
VVPDCCDVNGYDDMFGDKFAQRIVRRYRRRGLNRTQRRVVDFLVERGVEGATVLEIGGGIGEMQVELLRRGASHVTNLEISPNYESAAAALLEQAGVRDRVSRRQLDIAVAPDDVAAADVVILHRVVCCYPDYAALLGAAGSHARRLLVFTFPPRNWAVRTVFATDNLIRRLRGSSFRAFVHPPEAMVAQVRAEGLTSRYRHGGVSWNIVGFEREPAAAAARW